MSIPHTYIAHLKHSVVFVVNEDIHLSQVCEPNYKFDASKKFSGEKRPSHAASSGRKSLKKYDDQFTSSTSDTFR